MDLFGQGLRGLHEVIGKGSAFPWNISCLQLEAHLMGCEGKAAHQTHGSFFFFFVNWEAEMQRGRWGLGTHRYRPTAAWWWDLERKALVHKQLQSEMSWKGKSGKIWALKAVCKHSAAGVELYIQGPNVCTTLFAKLWVFLNSRKGLG